MSGGTGRHGLERRGGPDDSVRSRRRGTARIGWFAAGRLVEGEFDGPGAEDLRALLTVAAAPQAEKRADAASLEPVLAAFRRAAWNEPASNRTASTRADSARRASARTAASRTASAHAASTPRVPRSLAAKCAVVFFVIGGSSVAAASAGILPASVQRIAHEYFGDAGIPAPSDSQSSGTSSASGSPSPAPSPDSAGSGSATAAGTAAGPLVTLCRAVALNTQNWRSGLDSADQATLIAAAGGANDVKQYCADLLAQDGGQGQNATATPSANAASSQDGNPQATATHPNNGHSSSRSPSPHPTPSSHNATTH